MEDFKQRYIAARRAVIAQDLSRLNPMQRQAAMTTEGPLLLLAGAGSGKTTVLIQRVYNLLTYGRGSDSDEVPDWATEEDLRFLETLPEQLDEETRRRAVRLCAVDVPRPWEILAITFTNKAAGELKERLAARRESELPVFGDAPAHAAACQVIARRLGVGAFSAHELGVVELGGLLADRFEALALAARRRAAAGLLRQLDMRAVGELAHRLGEREVLGLHHETERVAARSAAEAVPQLGRRVDFERGRLLVVQRAAAPEVATALAHRSALADERDDVGRLAHLLDVFIADQRKSRLPCSFAAAYAALCLKV